MPERISIKEFHSRLKAQEVSGKEHHALVCPQCGTVQSVASLVRAGLSRVSAEAVTGWSCEGRVHEASARRKGKVRGCDWTLGGLFKIHELEVINPDGKPHPMFQVASRDEARKLERSLRSTPVPA